MAEIRNHTMNFASGRLGLPGLTCALAQFAYAEVHLRLS